MNLNAAGSLEDLTTQEENGNTGTVDSSGGVGSGGMCMSVQALKRLENLKIDKLKQIRRPTPPGRNSGNKLPALSGTRPRETHNLAQIIFTFIEFYALILK